MFVNTKWMTLWIFKDFIIILIQCSTDVSQLSRLRCSWRRDLTKSSKTFPESKISLSLYRFPAFSLSESEHIFSALSHNFPHDNSQFITWNLCVSRRLQWAFRMRDAMSNVHTLYVYCMWLSLSSRHKTSAARERRTANEEDVKSVYTYSSEWGGWRGIRDKSQQSHRLE